MSDRIRLSLWFSLHTKAEVLPRLAHAAEALPIEALERGVRQFSVRALDWNEPATIEERAERAHGGTLVVEAIEAMRGFVQEDCACEMELEWLLWACGANGWEQGPQPLRLTSIGPGFGTTSGEAAVTDGQLVVDFGLDEPFVAELAPWNRETRQHLQANIVQLLLYCQKVQDQLHPMRRRLWSDSEEDWTQKLLRRLRMAAAEPGAGAESQLQ